jgi:hypothetical protein
LLAEEETAKQRVAQLTEKLFQNRTELGTKAKQMRLAETAARKKVDDTEVQRLEEQHELDEMDEQLREIRTDAYVADRLVERRYEERAGSRDWLNNAAEEIERAWANSLHEKQATSEAGERPMWLSSRLL